MTYAPGIGMIPHEMLYVFLAFQLIDQIVLPVLVATFVLSKSAKRHPTVVNVCVTWIITGIVSSLLMYAGKHVGPEPPKMLCISQAALLDGVPPMTSVAVLALMYQTNLNIRKPKAKPHKMRTYALLIAPYVTFFCFALSAALLAVQHPRGVTRARRFFYCSFKSPISDAFAIFVAIMLLATTGYEIAIGVFLSRNWRALRQSGSLDMQFLTRVALFGVYVFLTLILSILSIVSPRSPVPDLFTASIGPMLALFLGTQPDIYRAWFCRPLPAPPRIIDDWVNVETGRDEGDKKKWIGEEDGGEDAEPGDLKYEYAVEGGNKAREEDHVMDINANFEDPRLPPNEDFATAAHDPDAKEVTVDVVIGRRTAPPGKI